MSGTAAILAGAAYWATRPAQPVAPVGMRLVASLSQPVPVERMEPKAAQKADEVTPSRAQPATDTEESTIAQYVVEKYRFLLDDLRYLEATRVGQLQRALLAREQLAGESNTAARSDALARAESEIRGMLRPADYATYETLRESDLELYKLNEYAGGISNVAPLSEADRKAILKTKLAYKERFRQLLLDSGLQRGDLGAAEREYAYAIASRALQDYQRSYLQEVRQYLTSDEQYALLSNYESSEFNDELSRLRATAGVALQGGS